MQSSEIVLEDASGSELPSTPVMQGGTLAEADKVAAIVMEYNKMIAGLANLTADLPKRLHIDDAQPHRSVSTESPRFRASCPHKTWVVPKASDGCIDIDEESGDDQGDVHVAPNGHTPKVEFQDSATSQPIPCSPSAGALSRSVSFETRSMFRPSVNDLVGKVLKRSHTEDISELHEIFANCCPCSWRRKSHALESLEEKEMTEKLFTGTTNALETGTFDVVVGILIMSNCFVMMVQLEYQGYLSQVSMNQLPDDPSSWRHAKTWFYVLEHVFNALFLIEIIARFAIYGKKLIRDKSVLFDTSLVLTSSIQVYILDPLDLESGAMAKLSLFRMLRFVRFVRVLRLVRVLKMFSALRVLVKTVVSSFGALLWSMILLLLIMIMSGLFLCELLSEWIQDAGNKLATRRWVFNHYGTSARAIYTLFEVTLAGCWPNYFRPLIEEVSGYYVIFAIVYISFVVFAIIRIITAIFLKETLTIASQDAEMMVQEKLKQKQTYVKKLKSLFEAVDRSGSGTLTSDAFGTICANPRVKTWLAVLDLEVHDAKQLFRLLDDGDGEVTYQDFLRGVMRLKGQARTMDVIAIMRKTDRILDGVKSLKAAMGGERRSSVVKMDEEDL